MSTNSLQNLNSLDFSIYIGSILQAAIQAQNSVSLSQIQFIEEIGFKNGIPPTITPSDLRVIEFEYKKEELSNVGTGMETKTITISVPLLTMLTIPALKIEEIVIDFNTKLALAESAYSKNEIIKPALGLKCAMTSSQRSASYQKNTSNISKNEKNYSMSVHMRVYNDEIPAMLVAEKSDPVSPIPKYTSDPPDNNGNLHEVILYWNPTLRNGKYHVYKMISEGNWIKIHELISDNEIIYLPLIQTSLASNTLKIINEDGTSQYHYFKIIAENFMGLCSPQENILTIHDLNAWEDIGGIGIMVVGGIIGKNTFVVR